MFNPGATLSDAVVAETPKACPAFLELKYSYYVHKLGSIICVLPFNGCFSLYIMSLTHTLLFLAQTTVQLVYCIVSESKFSLPRGGIPKIDEAYKYIRAIENPIVGCRRH